MAAMTIQDAYGQAADVLQAAGVPDPRTDAGMLLEHITGVPRLKLMLFGGQTLSKEQEQRFSSLLLSRASRKPLQYVLGEQFFYGLPFWVDERVLIPRPETEILCEIAIAHIKAMPAPAVLDVCTGSGAIAVTLARECEAACVTAVDISADALAVAQENARRNGAKVRFAQGDLFAPAMGERFDCIVSNPPYIESAVCPALQEEVLREPLLALDGGGDGLDFYRRIAKEAADYLRPGGLLCMEIGHGQAEAVVSLLREEGRYERMTVHKDLAGASRVVCAYAFPT